MAINTLDANGLANPRGEIPRQALVIFARRFHNNGTIWFFSLSVGARDLFH